MHNILIVDDEAGIRDSLAGILQDEGYAASAVGSGEACLDLLPKTAFDVVLLDVWLPGVDGLETLERIRELENPPEVIMISGHGTIETAVRATKLGAYDFLEKPLSLEKTLILVKNAVESKKLQQENVDLKKQLQGKSIIVGDSIPMKALRQQIALMAPTNGRVLIYGESGTGKELVARAIHEKSLRREHPFITLNCAAVPAELIESELFGHEKGAFTGAAVRHVGKFEQADGGTLFLDEIGDMPIAMQAKLLRVLEEGEVERVGGDKSIKVNVRVVVATHRNLEELVKQNAFRRDLFHRIYVFPLTLPPLHERPEDFPDLVSHFARQVAAQNSWKEKLFSEDAIAELRRGRKTSHWMWFVFPQIAGLGFSPTAQRYAISGLAEARAYAGHPVLGPRLRACTAALTEAAGGSADRILGPVDAMKLRSSMTLFAAAAPEEPSFGEVLTRYFDGQPDEATLARL